MSKYALATSQQYLPPAAPTAPQMFSVPRPSGGYDYYQGPPGSSPGQNNDYPAPVVSHANDIGVASVHIGRSMPRSARHVGSGDQARGSITAMPGAGGDIPGLEAPLSLGALGAFMDGESAYGALGMTDNAQGLYAVGFGLGALVPGAVVGAGLGAACSGRGERGRGALFGSAAGAVTAVAAMYVWLRWGSGA